MHTTTPIVPHRPLPPPLPRAASRRPALDTSCLAVLLRPSASLTPPTPPKVTSPIAFAETFRVVPREVHGLDDLDDRATTLVARLRRHLPERPLLRLIDANARPTPTRRPARPATPPPPPARAPHEPALVGRDVALARLRSALARFIDGAPLALLLRGPAESTAADLITHALADLRASAPDLLVLRGASVETTATPFAALAPIIHHLAHHLAALSPSDRYATLARGVRHLARLFPVLAPFITPASPAAHRGAPIRERAVAELRALLRSLAGDAPIVLVLDDLHLADRDSADFLDALLTGPLPRRVAILAQMRAGTEEFAALPDALVRAPAPIDLPPLDHELALDYAARRLRARRLPLDLAPVLATACLRSPVLMDTFAALLATLPQPTLLHLRAAPPTLDRLLAPYLDTLLPFDRILLEALALDGPIAIDVLDHATGQRCQLRHALHRLDRAGLLAPLSTQDPTPSRPALAPSTSNAPPPSLPPPTPPLALRHTLLREALVRLIPDERKAAHRRALARAHQQSPAGDLARLAHHHLAEGDREAAAVAAARATDHALAANATSLATDLCELALKITPGARDLRLRLADIQAAAGHHEEAANNLLRVALATTTAHRLDLTAQACEHLYLAGSRDRGLRTAILLLNEHAVPYIHSDAHVLPHALAEIAALAAHPLTFTEDPSRRLPTDQLRRIDHTHRIARLLLPTDPHRAAHLAAHSARLALHAGEPLAITRALLLAAPLVAPHDPALAHRLLARAHQFLHRTTDPTLTALHHLYTALTHLSAPTPDLDLARHHLHRADRHLQTHALPLPWEQHLLHQALARAAALAPHLAA